MKGAPSALGWKKTISGYSGYEVINCPNCSGLGSIRRRKPDGRGPVSTDVSFGKTRRDYLAMAEKERDELLSYSRDHGGSGPPKDEFLNGSTA